MNNTFMKEYDIHIEEIEEDEDLFDELEKRDLC